LVLVIDLLRTTQVLILVLGAVVVFFGLRGYRRHKSRPMLWLATGFAFVAVGAGIGGFIYEFLSGGDLATPVLVQAVFQVVGFFIIVYSITLAKE
jgi:hypothetical protein